MRFGTTETYTTIEKFRDYEVVHKETICEERVQIMKISDFDTIAQQMHIEHALQDHGCWVEHKGEKMYVVKRWIETEDKTTKY